MMVFNLTKEFKFSQNRPEGLLGLPSGLRDLHLDEGIFPDTGVVSD